MEVFSHLLPEFTGSTPLPGEVSLAHHGILFLDELPEFDRKVLEVLREPLENGHIHISRAAHSAVFPACFQFVGAMNPCPCGYLGHPQKACRCTPEQIARYRGKLSGPLLDRVDLVVEVPALPASALQEARSGDSSKRIRERVQRSHECQVARQGKNNAALQAAEVDMHCTAEDAARLLLAQAMEKLGLSARAYHRLLRVGRTIADLDGAAAIAARHMAEAIQLRRLL
ncbi:ATP-binding protein [Chitiniphilus eburneus]|uniref:ATP-binding protein n=1 Tax=Chitiniphilus eburneus TaxID=2571148 RepID=A0A4U0QN31_9NEIS|nr:ATP-binding protein [Chitiniphilus eburneus]